MLSFFTQPEYLSVLILHQSSLHFKTRQSLPFSKIAKGAEKIVEFTKIAHLLTDQFWPGPLTIILQIKKNNLSNILSQGSQTLAIRVPSHPVALDLLEKVNTPILAPSANKSGGVSPTSAIHAKNDFGPNYQGKDWELEKILDYGDCEVGIESTVIDCRGENPIILRHGTITKNMISNMRNLFKSIEIAETEDTDLFYFLEDDYIHVREAITEMLFTYEKISSQLNQEIFLCPADYPYLYSSIDNSKIFFGNMRHWRSVNETLITFLTSKKMINKYLGELKLMSTVRHHPMELKLHEIYKNEYNTKITLRDTDWDTPNVNNTHLFFGTKYFGIYLYKTINHIRNNEGITFNLIEKYNKIIII